MRASGSSTTSSRTSTSSSTSDDPGARVRALFRLVHPFPSLLDGLVVAGVALLAGGGPEVALRLGAAMTALQASIGAVNDLQDAPVDAGRVPPKPIPGGLVSPGIARVVAVGAAVVGLALAVTVRPEIGVLSLIVLGLGYAYDLVAKGTAWSWLPFAVGIPLLPVYGWLGAAGSLPAAFGALIPMTMAAGTALAIANARVDAARDVAAGIGSVATRLGPRAAFRAQAVAWVVAVGIGLAWLLAIGDRVVGEGTGPVPLPVALGAMTGAVLALAIAVRAGRTADDQRRLERSWEAQAVAAGVAAVAWLAVALAVPAGG